MKSASAISTGLHVAVLLWALVSFTGESFKVTPAESLPVDLVSETEFSQMMKGVKEAPKAIEKPKLRVEKIEPEPPKPIEDLKAKINDKKEIKAAVENQPPPEDQPKPDPIADKLKKEPKQEAKAEPSPLPPKRPPMPKQPKFEPDKIKALLDKRAPERVAINGPQVNEMPTLGTAAGTAANLSQSELDALRSRLMALWNPPVGIQNPEDYVIRVRLSIGRDRKLRAPPLVISSGTGQLFMTARDSAVRAVLRGQPFDMLKPEHYDVWKDVEVTFDPREMFGG